MSTLDPFTNNSQLGKPTRVMLARREFNKAYPQKSYRNQKIYQFKHGKMSMQTFIEKAYESGKSILIDGLNQPKNLIWDNESIELTNSAYSYFNYLTFFEE